MQQGTMAFSGHSYLQFILHVSIISRVVLPVSGIVLGGDWACDSSIATTCPTNCILVDPQSGCPFCKSTCQSASHQIHTQPSGSQGSGIGHTSGSAGSQPWTCDMGVMITCPTECITVEQHTGCMICMKDCAHASGASIPTSAPSSSFHEETKTTQAPSTVCPQFPSNCPTNYIMMENGCLVCTILQQVHVYPTVITTTTAAPVTCMPMRCVSPCNVGVIIMPDGCPACKCPDHV